MAKYRYITAKRNSKTYPFTVQLAKKNPHGVVMFTVEEGLGTKAQNRCKTTDELRLRTEQLDKLNCEPLQEGTPFVLLIGTARVGPNKGVRQARVGVSSGTWEPSVMSPIMSRENAVLHCMEVLDGAPLIQGGATSVVKDFSPDDFVAFE